MGCGGSKTMDMKPVTDAAKTETDAIKHQVKTVMNSESKVSIKEAVKFPIIDDGKLPINDVGKISINEEGKVSMKDEFKASMRDESKLSFKPTNSETIKSAQEMVQTELAELESKKSVPVDMAQQMASYASQSTVKDELSGGKSQADLQSQLSSLVKQASHKPSGAPAVALSSVDPASFVKSNPNGMYLVYEKRDGGTFLAKFSKEEVPDALAFVQPSNFASIPPFKYKKPVQIQTKIHSGKSMYYQAWAQWLKEARSLEGDFVLLSTLDDKQMEDHQAFPPFRMFFLTGSKVTEVGKGQKNRPTTLRFLEALAIVNETFFGMDDLLKDTDVDMRKFSDRVKTAQDKFFMEFK